MRRFFPRKRQRDKAIRDGWRIETDDVSGSRAASIDLDATVTADPTQLAGR
ncbi:hypothetical protein GOEFS_108_00010 [Gordonia effusa NBRC 100432]|uniref:Uncharacterized protein n=1 Tax=Gordonia effusa NBRC 100432 TaxID=1077974 RepID=H0R590_9ACTN|nr:hypothetical protein GOEFS_108_00010 [Gordonia effusa NBRC 100432]